MAESLFPGLDEEVLGLKQRAFFHEVSQMLEHIGVARSEDGVRTSGRLERFRSADQLVLELTASDGELMIEASAGEDEIIIAMSERDAWTSNWHFTPTWNDVYGSVADRAWTSLAVDFLAELLQGEVRVRATYRGDHFLKVHAEVIGSDGEMVTAATTGGLSARALNFRAKRRVEKRTVRFRR